MQDFNYHNPTQIVFGQNRFNEIDKLVPKDANVMITYGGQSAKKYGTIDKVIKALGSRKIVEFSGIEANPKFETLVRATELAKQQQVTYLLAVGGGSVMDGTKFIALAVLKPDSEYQDILSHGFAPVPQKEALPLACVATLPATGSEMNGFAVITLNEQKYPMFSPEVYPQFSLLDPDLTLTLPKEQIANGVADAFIHVIEQYLTYPVNAKVQDRTAEGILKTLIEDGPVTYLDNNNIEARKNFMWSATSALNGNIGVGVPQDWSTHMIGHEMTALFDIAHGRTLGIVLPHLLRARKQQKHAKLLQYAERVWDIHNGTEEQKVDEAITKTEAFFNSLDIVTRLSHYNIDEQGIEKIISNLNKMGMTALSETQDLGLDEVRKILLSAL
ncbi:iron-containing alcohol dehydrogenase [Planctobacterium marinum]|uniref:NADH-dependent alcohol dehydrogenase n=1 Tax=Planctobacterium marinum TaxID=1631968 RepID=A0AA48HN64_9ALTE|nr:NADH-dependent alcohol dehydrogenase [Planctobacterium marinum]